MHPSSSGLSYDSTLNMLHENALRLSTIHDCLERIRGENSKPEENGKSNFEAIGHEKICGLRKESLVSLSCSRLVLLRGELRTFLVRDVFNTFTGFLCNPVRHTDTMSVDDELQHFALSKIVGEVPHKI